MPTALVTGVAGFIGANLAHSLLEQGYAVRGVDNFETGRQRNIEALHGASSFTFVEGDVRDRDAMAEVTRHVDTVFHQAAVASVPRSVRDPVTTTDANCTGTATVLHAAREAGVDTVVVASSSSVYGSNRELPNVETMRTRPESPYALSKLYTEELALQFDALSDVDTVALRYFNLFGPRQDPEGEYAAVIPAFIDRMLDGDPPVVYGDGEQTRDFIYVDDAVRANVLAAESDVNGEAFNVARGESVTINDLVAALNDVLGTSMEPRYDNTRPGDIRQSRADISKAGELLGYEPEVGLTEGLRRTVEYYRQS